MFYLDLGPHLIDQVICLFGKTWKVYAIQVKTLRPGSNSDDAFQIHLHYLATATSSARSETSSTPSHARFSCPRVHGAFEKFGLDPRENGLWLAIRQEGHFPAPERNRQINGSALNNNKAFLKSYPHKMVTMRSSMKVFMRPCWAMASPLSRPQDVSFLQLEIIAAVGNLPKVAGSSSFAN